MTRILLLLPCLALGLLLAACGEARQPVRIGSHDFTEQKLLAEMMALLAEDAELPVERAIPYGDNRKSLEAIQRGVIDAYPEYDSTFLAMSGIQAVEQSEARARAVRELVEPLALQWLQPFGHENGFALAIRRDVSIRAGVRQISDLARLGRPIRFATDAGYLARPSWSIRCCRSRRVCGRRRPRPSGGWLPGRPPRY